MCMGYAKDIKAWACAQEVSRRDNALAVWAEMLHKASESLDDSTESMRRDLTPSLDMGLTPLDA